MNFIKRVRIKDTVDIDRRSLSRAKRKNINYSNVTELALHLVESVINAAVTFVEEDLNTSLLFFLCVLFLLSETELGVSGPVGALHRVYTEGRLDSQLPLHLLCTMEPRNCSKTSATSQCLCLLHHQDHQKQTSGKLLFPVLFSSDTPVDVSYIFEGHSLVQSFLCFVFFFFFCRPGMIRFRENWLREIIESKHILLESVPF
ncbi:A-kinase anchor protein 14 [Galemys pyrenaicus]|uniref:A-kinase anchor protein 14 n=1 Tax=Galemys pyrenaicus TaxID=202257 RepID=A0A8J6A336_GALPY|nr:A-kinase anchor protein 14 [Galemys pyrenaicus]